ncbi:Putative ribonuclease H protein At1g65750 [Linum perenne]
MTMIWALDSSGSFSVKLLARELILHKFLGCPDFPFERIWVRHVPTKVTGFVWKLAHGRVSTIDNLIRRGMIISNRCVLCGANAETIGHLFWSCPFTPHVWLHFSSRLSLFGYFPLSVRDWLWAWKELNCNSTFAPCVRLLLHGFLWTFWGERNDRIFHDRLASAKVVDWRISYLIGRWCVVGGGGLLDADRFRLWVGFCTADFAPDYETLTVLL